MPFLLLDLTFRRGLADIEKDDIAAMSGHIDKSELISKLQTLEGLTNDERSNLIGLLRQHKKYGLVWEDKPEDVEERLREELPVLREVKDKAILSSEHDAPNHILIEGDNLEALTALSYTHEGKIDVIYIDPPYNTGAQNWRYNNDFVDAEDGYRHSKWLSWMNKRLKMAKQLLKYTGNIIVTIDDYEYATLKIIMDEIFGEDNYLATAVIRNNPSGRSTVRGFSINHEYALFYSRSEFSQLGRLSHNAEQKSRYLEKDSVGQFEWENFRKNGTDSDRKDRPKQFYPIILNKKTEKLSIPDIEWNEDERDYVFNYNLQDDEIVLWPISPEGNEKVWKFGLERTKTILGEILVKRKSGKYELYRKKYLNKDGSLPHTWWDKADYSARDNGTRTLTNIFGPQKVFDFPKAPEAVKDALLSANLQKDGIILDFFAGSGTTLHATMQLNAEDAGHRQCILVTNNENNICEEVTYERNKRVINGYTTPKGVAVEGLKANTLRYYKTDFIPRERTQKNMRDLVAAATDLLCIKEDLYEEQKTFGRFKLKPQLARYFNDGKSHMLIIYREELIDEIAAEIKTMDFGKMRLKIYVFSPGRYPFTDNFREVEDKVELVALPAAIYDAYQKVLPKRKEKLFEEEKTETIFPKDLFAGQEEGGEQ